VFALSDIYCSPCPPSILLQQLVRPFRQRRLLFAGAVARQPDGRLPKRLMLGELVGGEKPGRGATEQNWEKYRKDDLKAFGATQGSTDDEPRVFGAPEQPPSTDGAEAQGGGAVARWGDQGR